MNTNRQNIEAKLPQIPQTLINHVTDLCKRAGVDIGQVINGVPQNPNVQFLFRSFVDYLTNSGDAKRVMLKLLRADVVEADYLKQYFPEGFYGEEAKKLDYRGLIEYRGYVYKGRSVPWKMIEVSDKPDLERCEACSGNFPKTYCVQMVRNGGDKLQTLCNHCRLFSDDSRTRDSAIRKNCEECKVKNCQFNPRKHYPAKMEEPPHPATVPMLEHKPAAHSWADPRYGAIQ